MGMRKTLIGGSLPPPFPAWRGTVAKGHCWWMLGATRPAQGAIALLTCTLGLLAYRFKFLHEMMLLHALLLALGLTLVEATESGRRCKYKCSHCLDWRGIR